MHRLAKVGVLAIAALGLATAPSAGAKEKLTGEAKLAQLLEGRTAGKPEDCLNYSASRDMRVIDKTAIVFRDGRTLWVNVPRNAEDLDDDDILVTKTTGSQLCRLDSVTTRDRTSYFFNGAIFLGDFVPYRKTDG